MVKSFEKGYLIKCSPGIREKRKKRKFRNNGEFWWLIEETPASSKGSVELREMKKGYV